MQKFAKKVSLVRLPGWNTISWVSGAWTCSILGLSWITFETTFVHVSFVVGVNVPLWNPRWNFVTNVEEIVDFVNSKMELFLPDCNKDKLPVYCKWFVPSTPGSIWVSFCNQFVSFSVFSLKSRCHSCKIRECDNDNRYFHKRRKLAILAFPPTLHPHIFAV